MSKSKQPASHTAPKYAIFCCIDFLSEVVGEVESRTARYGVIVQPCICPEITGDAMQQSQFYKILARHNLSRALIEMKLCTEREKLYRLNAFLCIFQFLIHHEHPSGFSEYSHHCALFSPLQPMKKTKLDPNSLNV